MQAVGVGSVTGTSIAYAGMLEFQTDIGNALSPSCGYVATPIVAACHVSGGGISS